MLENGLLLRYIVTINKFLLLINFCCVFVNFHADSAYSVKKAKFVVLTLSWTIFFD